MMSTQPHDTLHLASDGVKAWLHKNDIPIEPQELNIDLHRNKRLPPEIQTKSNNSNSTDTKQTIIQPIYSHSRSRTGSQSQASFVTNDSTHSDITASMITSEAIIRTDNNNSNPMGIISNNFQSNYKKLPGKPSINYRKSMSHQDSTKIESLQLIPPQSISNTPTSRDRCLYGSLIQKSRRYNKHNINNINNTNNNNNHQHHHYQQQQQQQQHPIQSTPSISKSNNTSNIAITPNPLDPISDNDSEYVSVSKRKSISYKHTKSIRKAAGKLHDIPSKQSPNNPIQRRKRSGSSLISSSTNSKTTHKSHKSKQSKSIILTKNNKSLENATTFSVDDWLSSMDILEYKDIFHRDGFDKLGSIVLLDIDDLRAMNIPKGHCKMILNQVHNLQNQTNMKPIHDTFNDNQSYISHRSRSHHQHHHHQRHYSNPDTVSYRNNQQKPRRKHSSHSTQSHSDPVIPPIDIILAFDDEYDDSLDDIHHITSPSIHKSCGFPDIDSNKIDLKRVHGQQQSHHHHHDMELQSVDTAGFHTFPRTSTMETSPLPINADIKKNKTPNTAAALQSLRVNIPTQKPLGNIDDINKQKKASQSSSDTSSSSLPSFHPTDLNPDEVHSNVIGDDVMSTNNNNKHNNNGNNNGVYGQQYNNMLPVIYRYQPPQQAQRYIVYHHAQRQHSQSQHVETINHLQQQQEEERQHSQSQIVESSNSNMMTYNATRKRFAYRQRQYQSKKRMDHRYHRNEIRNNNRYFISDGTESKYNDENDENDENILNEQRRHSICSVASNDYVLYQKGMQNQHDLNNNNNNNNESGGSEEDDYYPNEYGQHYNEDDNNNKKKRTWLPSRVYKRKKNRLRSQSKYSKHHQSKSGPLMNITAQKLFADKKCIKNKTEQQSTNGGNKNNNRIPWFLCGSSKNSEKNNILSPTINTEQKPNNNEQQERMTNLDLLHPPKATKSKSKSKTKTKTKTKSKTKSKSKTKTKSKSKSMRHNIIITTPTDDIDSSHTNSFHLVQHIQHNDKMGGITGSITPYSSYNNNNNDNYKTPEFIPREMYINQSQRDSDRNNKNIALSMSAEELDVHSPPTKYNDEMNIYREATETLNIAKELHRIGNICDAAEKYAEFLHYFRNDIDARIRYALCLLDLEKYELSKQQLDLLIDSDPIHLNNSMLQFVYGLLEHKKEHFNDALKHYQAALYLGYVYQDRIYNNLASLFRTCKDYKNAEKYQLLALQCDNRNYVAFLNYAKILCDVNRYNDAIKAYQNAISLRPDLADLHVEFGLFLMDIKEDYLLAAKQLNAAHKLSPENSEINDLLKQAIDLCGNHGDDDSNGSDLDIDVDVDNDIDNDDDDKKSDTIILLSAEESEEYKQRENSSINNRNLVLDIMEELQFNDDNDRERSRKYSLPMNLPKPPTKTPINIRLGLQQRINSSSSVVTRSQSPSPGYSPLKLAPRSKEGNCSNHRQSICDTLPPPHNPNNPYDPVRRNSLLSMNRNEISNYLSNNNQKNDIDDDAVSDVSELSILSDQQQI